MAPALAGTTTCGDRRRHFISQEALMLRKIQIPARNHARASASQRIGFWPDFVGNWPDPMNAERGRKVC
ncbi:hypothetical protein [Paenarthrobacter aromaticivorans]|uniref:Uncharacterized protein n=1 Tax=Paenarthrobacter aromaticivorans TaxID=2849150 RepID=A0ABS6I359_9MICC|nr:hypothetical protein [Paenarthrobacter sp. MMS21-TAE1-1]MBU8865071.1 hypothetical protein [Paenarthrobacter sp. MMS21-TAE1-1]